MRKTTVRFFLQESEFQKYESDKKRRSGLATVLMHLIKMHFVKIYDPDDFCILFT